MITTIRGVRLEDIKLGKNGTGGEEVRGSGNQTGTDIEVTGRFVTILEDQHPKTGPKIIIQGPP